MVMGSPSCATPLGTGYVVTWVIANDFNLTETGSVTDVTGGLGTLSATTYTVAATPNDSVPVSQWSHIEITQTLPAGFTPGSLTLDISSRWSHGDQATDTATTSIAALNSAGTTVQTLSGHIYLCQNDNPTTTEVLGGTIGATGPQTVPTQGNPLNPDDVDAGNYTMTATPPPGFTMVRCNDAVSTQTVNGSHAIETDPRPNGDGSSATGIRSRAGRRLRGRDLLRGGRGPGHDDHHHHDDRHPHTTGDPAIPDDTLSGRLPGLDRRSCDDDLTHEHAPGHPGLHRCAGGQGVDLGLGALILGSGLILASRIRTRRPRHADSKQ